MEVSVSAHAEAKQLRRKQDFHPRPAEDKTPRVIRSEFVIEMTEKRDSTALAQYSEKDRRVVVYQTEHQIDGE